MANRSSEGEQARGLGESSLGVEPHGLDELMVELIPGILNELTVDNIVTKPPAADVLKLPLISRAWQQIVQSQEIRNARLLQRTAESLRVVPVPVMDSWSPSIYNIRLALHSSDNKFFRTLPPIQRYWVENDQVIYTYMFLAGRIHLLLVNLRYSAIKVSAYMFDVTRGGQTWTESATCRVSIRKLDLETYRLQRQSLCCLKGDKFYVSGVLVPAGVGPGHMIYDPNLDSWSLTTEFQQEASTGRCICPPQQSARFTHEFCSV